MDELFVDLDVLLRNLSVSDEQLEIRNNSEIWIKDILNSGVSSKCFVIGASLDRLLLPNECTEMTQIFPKNQAVNWSSRTNEVLVNEAVKQAIVKPSIVEIDDIRVSLRNNTLQSVVNGTHYLFSANNVHSMFFSAILDEINDIVGNNSLFKRSILLLKAWMTYESRRFTHIDLSDIFTHEVIGVIVMWIFSSHSTFEEPIEHPLNVLHIFLEVFSDDFDWENFSISPTRITPLYVTNPQDSSIHMNKALQREFLSQQDVHNQLRPQFIVVLDNYQQRYDNKIIRDKPKSPSNGGTISPPEPAVSSFIQSNFTSSIELNDVMFRGVQIIGKEKVTVQDPVMLGEKNLLSPFFSNSKVNLETAEITSTFKEGYKDLCEVLQNVAKRVSTDTVKQLLPYTNAVATRQAKSVNKSTQASLFSIKTELSAILDMIAYSEVTIASKITAEMIIKLVTQVLQQSGPLPIGEIGKQLQTMTGNANLPKVLKKAFNGLKSFISNHSHLFKMGDNHDFNPYVYLVLNSEGVAVASPYLTGGVVNDEKQGGLRVMEVVPDVGNMQLMSRHLASQPQQQHQFKSSVSYTPVAAPQFRPPQQNVRGVSSIQNGYQQQQQSGQYNTAQSAYAQQRPVQQQQQYQIRGAPYQQGGPYAYQQQKQRFDPNSRPPSQFQHQPYQHQLQYRHPLPAAPTQQQHMYQAHHMHLAESVLPKSSHQQSSSLMSQQKDPSAYAGLISSNHHIMIDDNNVIGSNGNIATNIFGGGDYSLWSQPVSVSGKGKDFLLHGLTDDEESVWSSHDY